MRTQFKNLLTIFLMAAFISLPSYGGDGASAGGFFGSFFQGEFGLENPKYNEDSESNGEIIYCDEDTFHSVLLRDIQIIELNSGEQIHISHIIGYSLDRNSVESNYNKIQLNQIMTFYTDQGIAFTKSEIISITVSVDD